MRDCSNAEMRDRLPELMHGRLLGEELAATRAHVTGCPDCRDELALLERVRAASVTHTVQASRIVSVLPRYRAVPGWRRTLQSAQLRAAAAVVLLIGAYTVLSRSTSTDAPSPPQAARQETAQVATHELAIGDS